MKAYAWNYKDYWIPYHGTWTLDKAFAKDGGLKKASGLGALPAICSSLKTSLIHQVTHEETHAAGAELTVLSDMTHPEFRAVLEGHIMNGFGVATSVSIARKSQEKECLKTDANESQSGAI